MAITVQSFVVLALSVLELGSEKDRKHLVSKG